ncbi:hypothetical protein [Flagellimonas pacifica]|uniref:Uncharacterized protein n=1 Tax=Flagellimonas pacifica TaxID=1247520 RepID=A0A285MW68_9FLAO|nr:hypothetical protein [Allomuricauda parva]SNZ01435.1 hypothetical protein SAMN06265377_3274 [Allomuricauda parva]
MGKTDKFKKAMITEDFVYCMDGSEGDDNGSVKMYDKRTGRLISYNYRANQDMYENLLFHKYEWICKPLRYSRKCMLEEHKIALAQTFFTENRFPGKKANITRDGINGTFNRALSENLGFKLSAEELRTVHGLIKKRKKKNVLKM